METNTVLVVDSEGNAREEPDAEWTLAGPASDLITGTYLRDIRAQARRTVKTYGAWHVEYPGGQYWAAQPIDRV